MYLSIVIPAHNEQERIANCLYHVVKYLSDKHMLRDAEIIVAANGCSDKTCQIVRDFSHLISVRVHLLEIQERGKGLAIRDGMMAARGTFRYMADVDLSTPIYEIQRFLCWAERGPGVVIGSRCGGSGRVGMSTRRKIMGRVFSYITSIVVPNVLDTQCGFKMFTDQSAKAIFPRALINGMAADVEWLFLARQAGYGIMEIPVHWVHDPRSKVRVVRDSVRMALDVARIRALHAPRMAQVENKLPA